MRRGRREERGDRGGEPIRLDVHVTMHGARDEKLDRVLVLLETLTDQGGQIMAQVDDAIAKVQRQGTLLEGFKVLFAELKATQNDPVKMTALLNGLDGNTQFIEAMTTTPGGEPVPDGVVNDPDQVRAARPGRGVA